MEVLKQNQYSPMNFIQQTIEIFTAQHRYLDELEKSDIRSFLDKLWVHLNQAHQELLNEIKDKKELSDKMINDLKTYIEEFKNTFNA